jgi:hypothetical protein
MPLPTDTALPPTAASALGQAPGGNTGVVQIDPTTIHNLPPTVQIVAPTFPVASGKVTDIAFLAFDNNGLSKVDFFVAGKPLGSMPGSNKSFLIGTQPWTPASPGTYDITALAVDTDGMPSAIAQETYVVIGAAQTAPTAGAAAPAAPTATTAPAQDTEPPSVSMSLESTTLKAGDRLLANVNAVDKAGVVLIELMVDGNVKAQWTYDGPAGGAPQDVYEALAWKDTTAGHYDVYVRATDSVGNVGSSGHQSVTVN